MNEVKLLRFKKKISKIAFTQLLRMGPTKVYMGIHLKVFFFQKSNRQEIRWASITNIEQETYTNNTQKQKKQKPPTQQKQQQDTQHITNITNNAPGNHQHARRNKHDGKGSPKPCLQGTTSTWRLQISLMPTRELAQGFSIKTTRHTTA